MVVGVGARSGASADEVLGLVRAVLAEAGATDVLALATLHAKGREPGIVAAAEALGAPLETYDAERLAAVPVPHPSSRTRAAVGTPSVAEAAALVRGGELLVPKRTSTGAGGGPGRVTCAVARPG
ncbi:cobalamin biosynthesis protein [Streptomyces endophyticus]|uniref:cobalamin biosynthesis protein n=1 Tax=Streptomyces endophyticus TaxID=714166 RepID=UPI00389AFF49